MSVPTLVSDELRVFETFDEMGLPDTLLRGIYAHGFEKPSMIQRKAIVPIREGRDVLAQAQSGTGKTGAFSIGAMCRVDPTLKKPQILVLVPTRELAQQIEYVATHLGSHLPLSVYAATGGTPLGTDLRALERGAQYVIGTPGRIYDLMHRGALQRQHLKVLIMDEADQMLEDRFREQVLCILQLGFPKDTRIALFSATMPQEVIEFSEKLLQNPVRILVPPEEVTLDGIKQYYVELQREDWKYEVLCDLYQQLNINQAIIYCNKRQKVEWLAEKMSAQGFPLSFIHGEMDVEERRRRMTDFRKGGIRVLISTDLLARGIDVQQVSLVINYELPVQRENYVHRIGRSGRFGRKGVAINLLVGDEMKLMKEIETHYATTLTTLPEDLAAIAL
uniref:RNA helicase n=1 Tax=viral metagenome TaxID=1070528 RepID=A0A6C0BC79_9ZZZZ